MIILKREKDPVHYSYFISSLTFGFVSLAVPFRTKRAVVDKHMEIARFDEEVKLLQKEMMSFVNFYKSKVLPSLVQEQKRLENLLKGMFDVTM